MSDSGRMFMLALPEHKWKANLLGLLHNPKERSPSQPENMAKTPYLLHSCYHLIKVCERLTLHLSIVSITGLQSIFSPHPAKSEAFCLSLLFTAGMTHSLSPPLQPLPSTPDISKSMIWLINYESLLSPCSDRTVGSAPGWGQSRWSIKI